MKQKQEAKVYPGFFQDLFLMEDVYSVHSNLLIQPGSRYGRAAFWQWNFGDETTTTDTISKTPTPSWLYNSLGFKTVELIVESDKGCRDTVQKVVEVTDRAPNIFTI